MNEDVEREQTASGQEREEIQRRIAERKGAMADTAKALAGRLDRGALSARRENAATARELEEAADTYPGRLSGGMQRRVALAPAFAVEPEILLLDEPLVSLDAPTASRLRRLLVELWQGTRPAVLYVTHELREALAVADRVLFLSPGPGCVVLELRVDLRRPREPGDSQVGELHDRILRLHPEILAGAADRPGDEARTPEIDPDRSTS